MTAMNNTRILIVDDDASVSKIVQLMLERTEMFDVKVENQPHRAAATAREFMPHLILLDVDMPGKDGGDVASEIKADGALRYVPILFLTGLISRHEGGSKATMRGGMPFLSKPPQRDVLVGCIREMLRGAAASFA
jgi:DNA-binding response OmpR family regulator